MVKWLENMLSFLKLAKSFYRRRVSQIATGKIWPALPTTEGVKDPLSNMPSCCPHAQTDSTSYTQGLEGNHDVISLKSN